MQAKPTNKSDRRKSAIGASTTRAGNYHKIRRDHSSELAEDYVELIADLIRERGEARAVDIAKAFGVSHVTVTKTVSRLKRDGLVTSEPYRSIFLTDAGRKLAQRAAQRHELVVKFLRKLGVNETDAQADAEGIEHHMSEATMRAVKRYVRAGA